MKEQALSLIRNVIDHQTSFNMLREYLQHLILRELFEINILEKLVFHGGTALHIIYQLNRFSEDLDFHLLNKDLSFDLKSIIEKLISRLEIQGYEVSAKNKLQGSVVSSFIKFKGILFETDISPHRDEKISIKFDIDRNPPSGYLIENTLINKYFPFALICHNPSTFMAGKFHAILQRVYTKGRDFYDLWFFLSKWKDVLPNFEYLNNALKQTNYSGEIIDINNYKRILIKCISVVDWKKVVSDVEPFLENHNDLKIFKKEILLKMLEK